MLLNFHMSTLGSAPYGGHFSPLGAYDGDGDRLLLLDVWPESPSGWYRICDLWAAANTVDGDSQARRGLLHIARVD